MKTKKSKIFGIGAVVLMLLVAIAPAINGSQFEKTIGLDQPKQSSMGNPPDYFANITKCEFIKYDEEEDRVKYEIGWKVGYRDGPPADYQIHCTLYEKISHTVYADWEVDIEYPEMYETGTVVLWLISSENASVDEERYLAGKMIVLVIDKNDLNPSNNFDEKFVKYWKDNTDYIPTEPQVEVGAPCWGTKVYHTVLRDVYYWSIFDGEGGNILSNILLSKRMGWVGQLLGYLINISVDMGVIFGLIILYLNSIAEEIGKIGTWFFDVFTWFINLLNGNIIPGMLIDLFNNFIDYVIPAVISIVTKAIPYLGAELVAVYKLWDDINNTYNWYYSGDIPPMYRDIKIDVFIDYVKPGETVQVTCRNHTEVKTRPIDAGTGPLRFIFYVTSECQGNERFQIGIHNCQVKVKGDKHYGEAKSRPLLSYAFANGYLYWEFPIPGIPHSVTKEFFANKLKNLFIERPIFTLLEKILSKIGEETEQTSFINRDFDLDALTQRTLNEEKQYEPYDVEYREFYPGVPRDTHIVYYASDQVLVRFIPTVDVTKIDEVEGYPVVDKLVELNTVIVEIYAIDPAEFIEIVEQREDVEYAELNFVYQTCFIPNDPLWNEQWGLRAINCPQAWDIERGDTFYGDVAILDTGCNKNHEDIPDTSSYLDYDFVNNDKDPSEDCFIPHGTHCAGIICAKTDNGNGISGIANIMPHYGKVLDSQGYGYASNIAKAIIHMSKLGHSYMDVISMSLGGYGISTTLHLACNYAYYVKGVLIVAAAGNDGLSKVCIPARFESVISVGAVDENLKLCSWSNHGPDLDLVAPGNDIISTVYGNEYEKLSGTSMATPHVAGAIVLYFCENPSSTAVLCKGKLFSTAKDLGSPGKDSDYGYGLVNAYELVRTKSKSVSLDFQQLLIKLFPRIQQFI